MFLFLKKIVFLVRGSKFVAFFALSSVLGEPISHVVSPGRRLFGRVMLCFFVLILGLKGLEFDRVVMGINSFIAASVPSFYSLGCFSCPLALIRYSDKCGHPMF